MNIKKLLKSGAKDVLPDEKIKEDIKQRVGIEGDEREAELGGIKAKIKNNKKLVAAAACVLAAAALGIAYFLFRPAARAGRRSKRAERDEREDVYF